MLQTERLILRQLTPDDAQALYRIYREPEVLKFFPHGPPESVEAEAAAIEKHQQYHERHGFGLWATVLRSSGELIGRCGLLAQQIDGAAETEIAYLLAPRFWGKGLASEAARAIRDHALYTLGHARLVSVIHPQNVAAKRVAAAIGMTFSTVSRYSGIDVEVFSLTRPWNRVNPA